MRYLIILFLFISCTKEANYKEPVKPTDYLIGIWQPEDNSSPYTFKGAGKGTYYFNGLEYELTYDWDGGQTIWIYKFSRGTQYWFYDKTPNRFRLCMFNDTIGVIYNRK